MALTQQMQRESKGGSQRNFNAFHNVLTLQPCLECDTGLQKLREEDKRLPLTSPRAGQPEDFPAKQIHTWYIGWL